jgi:hypothetical protein
LAGEKLVALEAKLRDLQSSRRELLAAITEWDQLLAKTPKGKPARLLESFAASHSKGRAPSCRLTVLARGNQKQEKQK